MEGAQNTRQAGLLDSSFPVLVPFHPARTFPQHEFESFLRTDLGRRYSITESQPQLAGDNADTETFTAISSPSPSTTADVSHATYRKGVDAPSEVAAAVELVADPAQVPPAGSDHPFMKGLVGWLGQGPEQQSSQVFDEENNMLTENADVAYRSTMEPLVDLFAELEDVVSRPRLRELLDAAWRDDPLATLKIIFNARSIHLGKSSRVTFYCCAGWLAQNHPLTLLGNLPWLIRPIIEKVVEKDDERDEMVLVDPKINMDEDGGLDKKDNDPTRFDVRNGVAHGYWKDLLNLLVLSVQGKLDVLVNPRDVLNIEKMRKNCGKKPQNDATDQKDAKLARYEARNRRHEEATRAFNQNPVYRALHLTVARLFAAQLKTDLAVLRDDRAAHKKKISLCAKWSPSQKLFHDKHTFIVSTIAENLHPRSEFADIVSSVDHEDENERELYLRHAREAYRKDIAALRKHLQVVERDLTANTLDNIKYERVPSLAMSIYCPIFTEKDTERFEAYIDSVAAGQAQISGATLLPSTLIKMVRDAEYSELSSRRCNPGRGKMKSQRGGAKEMITQRQKDIRAKAVDGQWRALFQRIKKSGTLSSSIAVCDVSGSMLQPVFPDGTCPMDTAIGLSLVLAEVTDPPFGGSFIRFSQSPIVEQVLVTDTLQDKYRKLSGSNWGMNTDFVAVFEKLILPMAQKHKLRQEHMVKRVFVFSDMQFDTAQAGYDRWTTSYKRIQKKFRVAGYEMPQLVFWNIAGGRAGYQGTTGGRGDQTAPKPVTAAEENTAIVSGYSPGMLKIFLENGSFEDPGENEEVIETTENEDAEIVIEKQKKSKMDALSTVRRAINHKAYSMLEILD